MRTIRIIVAVTLLVVLSTSAADSRGRASNHWSFQPLRSSFQHSSIDGFISERLVEQGLGRNPQADPRVLIRRMSFDLTGLPPTPEQVKAFVDNPDVSRLIDDLLASPRYGERWAQHWLDVIRWAETVGFETNAQRPSTWHYRDWVIAALNEDKPYDQFIKEQLIGDVTGDDPALGFLVAGPANLPGQIGRDEAAMRGARQDELDEVIRTVSQSIMGLTIGCARCHDHKFDPILERDYYSLQAVFAGLGYGTRRMRGRENDEWTSRLPAAREVLTRLRKDLESKRLNLGLRKALDDVQTESFEPVKARAVRMRIDATANRSSASLYELEIWSEDGSSENVALAANGGRPSASSFALANQSRHFDNLVDGTVDKRQAYPWVSAKGGAAWVRVDLKVPQTIHKVVWHRGRSLPVDYVIEILPAEGDDWLEVAHTRDRLPRTEDVRKAEELQLSEVSEAESKKLVSLLAAIRKAEGNVRRLSSGPQTYAASFNLTPLPTYLLRRGDAMQTREVVAPDIPKILGGLRLASNAPEVDRRKALAEHLINKDHPLTARVIVNRVWHYHFGAGLVATPSDFGRMGIKPSHPELLDWLARRFMEEGWSLKKLHRLIMSSETYQQSSHPVAKALEVDADTRLLWRFPPRRLEAEAIRDSILNVSGKLSLKMGGPGFDFFNRRGGLADYIPKESFDEKGWRRMIYAHKIRMVSVDVFGAFDCPDAGQMKPKRTRSITPVQSLGLLNSPFANRQADFFAQRLKSEMGTDLEEQIRQAFALAYSRPPNEGELKHLSTLSEGHGMTQVCRAILNSSEFVYLQ